MKILWMSWKDLTHPLAGGAELVNEELAKRLVADGYEVIFLVGGYKGCKDEETINGYKVVRLGNRLTVYIKAWLYYRKNLKGWGDLVIDELNTVPFFAKFYVKERNILFVHQLCREIWFYQLPKIIAWVGYIVEPVYLRLLTDRKVITVSESTKADLMRFGFRAENISIISEGIEITPIVSLEVKGDREKVKGSFLAPGKYKVPTLLSLGSIRPMKRTLDQIKAFEILKVKGEKAKGERRKGKGMDLSTVRLIVAGDNTGSYAENVLKYIANSRYRDEIEVLGKVGKNKKIELMQKCHLLMATSIKEGWCLVVTEANSQGTPAVVYDVDGLRDSVKNDTTGSVVKPTSDAMAEGITTLLNDKVTYNKLRKNAHNFSKSITFENCYRGFLEVIRYIDK